MSKLYNLARVTTATTGTGTITLGAAVSGYLTFALAGVSDGDVVSYAINDGANSEIGTGTYTAAGTTLTRAVTKSTNANAAISLSGTAQVFITDRAEDYSWNNARIAKTANYTVSNNSDKYATIALGGSTLFTLTVGAASGYDANFMVAVVNEDTGRGKIIALNGLNSFILWPLQSILIYNQNNVWQTLGRARWRPPPSTAIDFYSDFTNGTDTVGATDGLASGAAAFKSVERTFLNAADQIDYNTAQQTTVRCNMAANTVDTQGLHSPVHAFVGAQGGAAFQIIGASLAISNVVSNAGLCKITVPSTATYTANQVVSVYGVAGATGCNGTWKVTVTSGTELTLQGTTFGGAYTSGGTVTNGSSIGPTSLDAAAFYFGTVVQFSNVTFASVSGNNISVQWGAKVYLQSGNIFGGTPANHIAVSFPGSQVHFEADIGIASGAANSFGLAQRQGMILTELANNLNFVPGINPSFSGLAFVWADSQGQINFGSTTIVLNGNTVTGQRFNVSLAGFIGTGTGVGNLTYFPGSTAGAIGRGSAYDAVVGAILPTVQTFTSGTAATYTTPANCLWIEVYCVGGGGGGGGAVSGTTSVVGSNGSASTFNSINANPGSGAPAQTANTGGPGGAGGSGGTGTATRRMPGNPGEKGGNYSGNSNASGSGGGSVLMGGAGTGLVSSAATTGNAGATNTGGGGGGSTENGTNSIGAPGGGGGESFYLIINSPSATYTYTVGSGGAGGVGGTTGGAGAAGYIQVIEHYGS